MIFYIAVCLLSCAFIVRQYRKATSVQRHKIAMAGIGAVAVALFMILLITAR